MNKRFYVIKSNQFWSLSKDNYLMLLRDGIENQNEEVNPSQYKARLIKKPPIKAQPIDISEFEPEHYQEELEYFLKTGEQTGFSASDFINVFFE